MAHFYTDDKATQIVLALLKAHGIHRVIASPGTTNISLVGSMQIDPYFQIYSSVDERSAAYMACGLAYETGEPVAITCTEATASRNYFPGLTEAYYRKLPILAITGNHGNYKVGHLKSQTIDRTVHPKDTVMESVDISKIKDKEDEWETIVNVNKAILALFHNGGGPSHINLQFSCNTYNTKTLPLCRVIKRVKFNDELPDIPTGRIAIFIGVHKPFSDKETIIIDNFCKTHNAAVLCDKTSSYHGAYRIDYAIISSQLDYDAPTNYVDLIIHIGEVSGDTYTQGKLKSKSTWRISEDGEIKDTFRSLRYVFQMKESEFFSYYRDSGTMGNNYYEECSSEVNRIISKTPEVDFSNIWVAKTLASCMPDNVFLHLGIYNSLRSWNLVQMKTTVKTICNVGGFGIDGALSTAFGSSLAHPDILHYVVLGDLAFFYDMNALGNRYLSPNLRVLVINNGRGTEFRKYDHPCYVFGEDADPFMAAAGHYGNKSETLIRDYAINLGFEYMTASSKDEFIDKAKRFVTNHNCEKPMLFEVFTDSIEESKSIDVYRHIEKSSTDVMKNKIKKMIKTIKS